MKYLDGNSVTGWFVEDFTLAELKTVRARERLPNRSHAYDGQFEIPTFDEVLALAARATRERGRPVGVYPETKSPSYFRRIGLPLEEPLVAALKRELLDRADAPVFIQSFEAGSLERLRAMTSARLVQLLDVSDTAMATTAGLRAIARYAQGVGVHKQLVIPSGRAPTSVVADAHAMGLTVHVWTFRSDAPFLAAEYAGNPAAEYRRFLALGIDGVFSDFPDHAVAAIARRLPR